MKRIVSVMLVFFVIVSLCACSQTSTPPTSTPQEVKYTIQCNDGTTKQMSVAEIVEMYNNNEREFERLLKGALISGSGIVTEVGDVEEANWNYSTGRPTAWQMGITLEDGISLSMFFAPKDNHPQLYRGDKVEFTAQIVGAWTDSIAIGVHYQIEETYVRYTG